MRKLSYEEMLKFPESADFEKRDDQKALADYLVRRLYGKKLSDFDIGESFEITAQIATLTITESGSDIVSNFAPAATLAEMFKQANGMSDQIKTVRANIANLRGPGMMEMAKNAMASAKRIAKGGFAMVEDAEYARRMGICAPCEFWDATARVGMGKCLKCGCTSAKLRFSAEKCPLDKWGVSDTFH